MIGAKLLIALQLMASGADAYYTQRNVTSRVYHELNPIAAPFMTHGTKGVVMYFSLEAGAKLGVAYLLHRKHHDRLARTVLILGTVDNSIGATYSAEHHRGR